MSRSLKVPFLSLPLLTALSASLGCAQHVAPHTTPDLAPVARARVALTDGNLALNKPFASSEPNSSGWNKGLTDGSWRSAIGTTFATGPSSIFPKTVTVDLQSPQSIGSIAVGVPPFGSTKTVSVAISTDGTTWNEMGTYKFSLGKEEKHLFPFPATTARYTRLTYLDHYQEIAMYPNGHAFTTELAVYAPGATPVFSEPVARTAPTSVGPADIAAPKYGVGGNIDSAFLAMHKSFLKRAKAAPIGVLFIGDSITFGWRTRGKSIWDKSFSSYEPANFGISGDKTQHLLWRIENGELDGIRPKVVVLLAGTNNLSSTPADVPKAVKKIVSAIDDRLPTTKVLLLGIFSRGAKAGNPFRAKIKCINRELAQLDDGQKVRFLDIGDKFLAPDGSITFQMISDALHLTATGYQLWADAIYPLLDEMMKG